MTNREILAKGAGVFLILCVTALVYHGVYTSDFISMDDPVYVTDNPFVSHGLSMDGIRWAFDFGHESGPYWMPVTMLSHMIDCDFFGLDPAKHHLHNLIWHLVNSLFVFVFFFKVSKDYGKSLMIMALFALHPLNVESVAWVTSRKNVLSTFFWLSTMLVYVRYQEKKGLWAYLLVFLCFVLGLMSKASVITLIFSLLLLDIWPFYRFILFLDHGKPRLHVKTLKNVTPLLEKVPFLVFTGLILYINFSKASFVSEATPMDAVPMLLRLSNALTAYGVYVIQVFFPLGLSVHYPYPSFIPWWKTMAALVFVLGVSVYVIYTFKKKPWLFVGWFWFVGNLVMVSGLIQGGLWPAHADRFMYVASIGLFLMICWDIPPRVRPKPKIVAAVMICMILAGLTWVQVGYWKNGICLYRHALEVNDNDRASLVNLAFAQDKAGLVDEAMDNYTRILSLYPQYAEAHSNLGAILAGKGKDGDALVHFEQAMDLKPELDAAWLNAGLIYEKTQETEKAVICFEFLFERHSNDMKILTELTRLLINLGRLDKAATFYEQALDTMPHAAVSLNYNLACVYAMKNDVNKSMYYLEKAMDGGFSRWDILNEDEQLDTLRNSDEFKALLRKRP